MSSPIPEVRQCQDQTADLFGATAVAGDARAAGLWGVFHPSRGGHWAEPEEVSNWAVIQQPGAAAAAEAPAEEPPAEEPAKAGGRRR